MHHSRYGLATVAAAFALAIACSDGSGPGGEGIEGDYPLAEVGGEPLPAFDRDGNLRPQDSLMITGGTLRVLSRGRVSIITNVEWWSDLEPNGIGFVAPETLTVAYDRIGDTLIVPFPNAVGGAYADTIVIMNGFLRMSRLRAHMEGSTRRRHFTYLEP
jgi:hypothetical protein